MKPIADLEVGEAIYGTAVEGRYRRLTITRVHDKWSSVKPAYLVELEDGTEIVASEDHRFLTHSGWRYVLGSAQGRWRRPHLTRGIKLIGIGRSVTPPGCLLTGFGVETRPPVFAGASGSPRAIDAMRTEAHAAFAGIHDITADLRVVDIRPLGKAMRMYDITTGTGDFIAEGVVSHNCFARPTHKYLDFNAGHDFEREIVVKVNAPELLRAELRRPSWEGEHVALGTNTDPYQWVEGRYKLMTGIWEAMRDAENPCSILTKSPLLLRDLPIMKQIAERTDFSAALSIPTLDEKAWRATEPHTPNPKARLEALAELTRSGITTGVLVAPLMPGINDSPEQVERIVELATEAGASYVSGIALHLRGDVKGLFFEWLEQQRPDLLPRYRQLYKRGAYAPQEERRRLSALVRGQPGKRAGAAETILRAQTEPLPGYLPPRSP
jgi:DNA repair photolyase